MSNRFYLQSFGALEWDPDALISENYNENINEEEYEWGKGKLSSGGKVLNYKDLQSDANEPEKVQLISQETDNASQKKNQEHNENEILSLEADKENEEPLATPKESRNENILAASLDKKSESNNLDADSKIKTTLNYREFLTNIVKFKKVIPLIYEKRTPEEEEGSLGH